MRIGVVQYDPKITEVQNNLDRIREFLKNVEKGSLDLLCLPETALTGYVFPTPKDILPYLEEPKTGVTSLFCQELANNLGCFVVIGYPEQLRPDEDRPEGRQGQDGREKVVAANSAIIFGPGGEHIGGYRKTNLFVADLPWAKPGTGFAVYPNLSEQLQTVSLGICNDLNPAPDQLDWPMPCELASFALSHKSRILVLLCAWLESVPDEPTETTENTENIGKDSAESQTQKQAQSEPQWCIGTVEHWIARLLPLWSTTSSELKPIQGVNVPSPEEHDETIVVICNRTGVERGSTFAGSSMILRCSRREGKWDIVGILDKKFEGFRAWNVE